MTATHIAYLPRNIDYTPRKDVAYRTAAFWRGEVENGASVTVHPNCGNRARIESAYLAAGKNIVPWEAIHETAQKPVALGAISDLMWSGEDVVIVGGGPSLKGFDWTRLKDFPCKVIAINRAYEFCDPDILFSMDKRFFDWAQDGKFGAQAKEKYLSLECPLVGTCMKAPNDPRVINLGRAGIALSKSLRGGIRTGGTRGGNSGFAAIHLATILGANRIYLLGFDCNETPDGNTAHFHSGYHDGQTQFVYDKFRSSFSEYAKHFNERAEIVNCNRASGVTCFPFGDLPDGPLHISIPRILCAFTPSYQDIYEKWLKPGLDKFELMANIVEMKSSGNWKRNASQKADIIAQERRTHPTGGIVWLDADSSIERIPRLFGKLEADGVDFAAHTLKSGELLSSTLYFGATEKAQALLDEWERRATAKPEQYSTADQRHLQDAAEALDIKPYPLPAEYCKIFDHKEHAGITNPVIVQHQASRQMRRRKA